MVGMREQPKCRKKRTKRVDEAYDVGQCVCVTSRSNVLLRGSLVPVALSLFAGCTSSARETAPAPLPVRGAAMQSPRQDRSFAAPSAPASVSRATPETHQVVKAGLDSSDWMVRLSATSALGCLPGVPALNWLERQLADVEADVRAAAIEALRFRREPRALSLLVSVQDDTKEDLSLRVLAAAALSRPPSPCR